MKNTFLLLSFAVLYSIANAQSPVDTIQASAQYTTTDQAYLDTLDEQLLLLEEREITVNIIMAYDSIVSQLIVMLGTDEGSNNIFYKKFDYGSNGNFSDGTSYQSNGNNITVKIGRFSGMPRYYVEVIPIAQDGSMNLGAKNILE